MKIEYRRPFARGVTEIMYVGDDAAVEKATARSPKELGAGAVALLVALKSKGIVRLAAAGIATVIGVRAYQAYR